MAAITVVQPAEAGAAVAFVAAGVGGDTAVWANDLKLHVKNGSGGSITVTIDVPGACNFGTTDAAHDKTVSVGAGLEKIIHLGNERFRQTDGTVAISYSAVTTVTVAAYRS